MTQTNLLRKMLLMMAGLLLLGGVTTARAQETFKRGLEQVTFIPKGQWIGGVSVSYSQSSQDHYQFLIIEGITGESYTFKVAPMVFYTFKDNMAAGGRFGYRRNKIKLDAASVVLDSETSYDISNLYSLSQQFYGTLGFRNYISLGHSRRFGFFNEVQMEFGGGESKLVNGVGDELTGTFERSFTLDIGLAPGLIVFLNNYSAIEVNVGVLGFSYNHTKSTTDQIYIANRKTQSANFRLNLFSINFGVAFYL